MQLLYIGIFGGLGCVARFLAADWTHQVVGRNFPYGTLLVNVAGSFLLGFLLGLVWLPCVGPTLGAAIALASMGQSLVMAFIVMLAFGLGTALTLLLAALLSNSILAKAGASLSSSAAHGKMLLGFLLLLLGLAVIFGWDKQVEMWAVNWLPEWTSSL